jgi:hypothetical protein
VHEDPVVARDRVARGDEAVVNARRARVAAAIQRLDALVQPVPIRSAKIGVVRRKNDENMLDPRFGRETGERVVQAERRL